MTDGDEIRAHATATQHPRAYAHDAGRGGATRVALDVDLRTLSTFAVETTRYETSHETT